MQDRETSPSRDDARVLAVVQARMTSSRLPGKVLEDLGGEPVLRRVLDRLGRAGELDGVVLATSTDPSDDPVAAEAGIPVVRGALHDVLGRYRQAVAEYPCDAIVRITADCPLIDPEVVDRVVRRWRDGTEAYVANNLEPRTFPKGLDTEVVNSEALTAAAEEATDPYDREHVTPFVRARPERFPQAPVFHDPPFGGVRITLDTPDDLRLLRRLVDELGPDPMLDEVLAALGAQPDSPH
jgi:spore coat polysaccharide biosynthesis protein SpsF